MQPSRCPTPRSTPVKEPSRPSPGQLGCKPSADVRWNTKKRMHSSRMAYRQRSSWSASFTLGLKRSRNFDERKFLAASRPLKISDISSRPRISTLSSTTTDQKLRTPQSSLEFWARELDTFWSCKPTMGSLLGFTGQDTASPKYVCIHASLRNQSYKNKITQETYVAHYPRRRIKAPRDIPLFVSGSFPAREFSTYGQIKI